MTSLKLSSDIGYLARMGSPCDELLGRSCSSFCEGAGRGVSRGYYHSSAAAHVKLTSSDIGAWMGQIPYLQLNPIAISIGHRNCAYLGMLKRK